MIYRTNNSETALPVSAGCSIGNDCPNDVLTVLGEASGLRDPDNTRYYTYSSDGSDYVISSELSTDDNYYFDSSIGNYSTSNSNPPVPGSAACGTSDGTNVYTIPTENLCTLGTASTVSGSGPWTWDCVGTTTDSCFANKKVDGTCGTAVQTFTYDIVSYSPFTQCETGTSSNTNFPAQGSSETWTCNGENGGSTSGDCTASRDSGQIDGTCGTAVRTFTYDETSYGSYTQCATGTPSITTFPAQGGSVTWTCLGVNGGSVSGSCTASRNSACGSPFTDSRNSKTYNTVQIGTQCWMKENMDYNNGCQSVTWVNSTDNGWCGYYIGGPFTNEGLLYQWSAAMNGSTTAGAQGICPVGWHVPTDAEWNTLETYTVQVIASAASQYPCDTTVVGWRRCSDNSGTDTGGPKGVGKSLKKVGQGNGVGAGDDLVGFSSLLPGYRDADGTFHYRSSHTYLWSSSPSGVSAWNRTLNATYSTVYRHSDSKAFGFSVRCLKN